MEEKRTLNQMLPGNPRYQPKQLVKYFGYDNLESFIGEVEYAALIELVTLLERIGRAPKGLAEQIEEGKAKEVLVSLITSDVDEHERKVTKHDIRAFVQLAQKQLDPETGRMLHLLLTSYDVIDTAASLRFKRCFKEVTRPALMRVLEIFCSMAEQYKDTVQIGRTHGQHAVPITVGFWLATIISRIMYNWMQLERAADNLVGKISGPVGAYNAYMAMGLDKAMSPEVFEETVLKRIGLESPHISTQILPPEHLADFLYASVMLSGSFAQFANDCRHLMRSEIGEIREEYVEGQVGSSTMAHKRNPIVFENICGAFTKNKVELLKVMETVISEHQRDLTASSVMRDFPVIIVNLHTQLDNLLREKDGKTFLERIQIDLENLERNFSMNSDVIMSEPVYIALQLFGYTGDAHTLVNKTLVPLAKSLGITLNEALSMQANKDPELKTVLDLMPKDICEALCHPEKYTGIAAAKAEQVADDAREYIDTFKSVTTRLR